MEYKRFDDTIYLRLDPKDEICDSIIKLSNQENIETAVINGLGATNDFTVGIFDILKKEFLSNNFTGCYEIVSLTGTLTRMDEKPYLHLHMSAGDINGNVVGGHLKSAVISATAEIVIRILDGKVGRLYDDETGLNIFNF